jgi:hypothetical protein
MNLDGPILETSLRLLAPLGFGFALAMVVMTGVRAVALWRDEDVAREIPRDFEAMQNYVNDARSPSDDADQLAKLADLHAAGKLNDDEFAKAKARVLSR